MIDNYAQAMELLKKIKAQLPISARPTRAFMQAMRDMGSYGLLEFYYPDPNCDCRRVMLNIAEERGPDRFLASISYGFDRNAEDAGPFLDPLNPQSRYAEELLQLVEETVLSDPRYVARLERHYHLVKEAASDPTHPAYDKLQKVLADDADSFPLPRPARRTRKKPRPRTSQRKRRKR
jgi:hypothetical protein